MARLASEGSGGHGTGVLRAYYACYLIRGLTVGIAGASSLAISEATGLPQNLLVASRGVGLVLGPTALSPLIGRLLWSGNSEAGVAGALALKMACELVIPQLTSPLLLYLAFLLVGMSMAMLDTFATLLIARAHGPLAGRAFLIYDTLYGTGCMIAPFIVVTSPRQSWLVLAAVDFVTFAALAAKRLRRGKPRAWKQKVRGAGPLSAPPEPGAEGARAAAGGPQRLPARVLRAGLAFSFAVQVTMTAVSCWAFTYAVCSLGLPQRVAAAVPAVFYASCTLARVALVPVSSRLLPSTIMHAGALLAGSAAVLFYWVDGWLVEQAARGQAPGRGCQGLLLACFAMMGAGFCPHHTMTIAAMQRHGTLSPQVHGWYGTSTCLGITFGMFLPGMFGLPLIELLGSLAILLIINGRSRDFPRWSWLPAQGVEGTARPPSKVVLHALVAPWQECAGGA